MSEVLDVDTMARILCRIENRSKGRSIEDVLAPGIELWMRHRYEAERLLEELSDWCYPVQITDPEPWVDQDGTRWSDAKKDGYLSRGPSTFTFEHKPRVMGVVWSESVEYAYGVAGDESTISVTGEDIDDRGTAQWNAEEFWVSALQRTVRRSEWSVVNPEGESRG